MQQVWILTKREIRSYFDSLTAYVVLTIFLLITGWFFGQGLFPGNVASLQTVFDLAPIIFMFFVPAITMGTFAEERRSGTIELLLTLPVRDSQVIVAKVLASSALILVALACTLFYVFTISILGDPDGGATFGGYLGLSLYGITCGAIGVWASSMTKNQIVAFILGFAVIFFLFMLDKSTIFLPDWMGAWVEYLGIDYHYRNLLRGVIDTRDLLYYFSLIFFSGLLTSYNLTQRPD